MGETKKDEDAACFAANLPTSSFFPMRPQNAAVKANEFAKETEWVRAKRMWKGQISTVW